MNRPHASFLNSLAEQKMDCILNTGLILNAIPSRERKKCTIYWKFLPAIHVLCGENQLDLFTMKDSYFIFSPPSKKKKDSVPEPRPVLL